MYIPEIRIYRHPIEINEVLQGFDIPQLGPHGPHCSSYSKHKLRKETDHGSSSASFQDTYGISAMSISQVEHRLQYLYSMQQAFDAEYLGRVEVNFEVVEGDTSEVVLLKERWHVLRKEGQSGPTNAPGNVPFSNPNLKQGQTTVLTNLWEMFIAALPFGWKSLLYTQPQVGVNVNFQSSYAQVGAGLGNPDDVSGGLHDGEGKSQDRAGGRSSMTEYCERWEDMVEEVNTFFEWSVANRQNKVQWLLLGSHHWDNHLHTRQHRLAILVELGHHYSLVVGANSPLGNVQQHGWFMADTRLSYMQQVESIKSRVDWIFEAGFDFLTTESGSSEFTHPECSLMLDLLNVYAEYVSRVWGKEAGVKVHCSTGQVCPDFPDPRTGEPINFNFLPTYAIPELGVFPHTIQVYSFDDPTSGVYGNHDFGYMEDYLVFESKRNNERYSADMKDGHQHQGKVLHYGKNVHEGGSEFNHSEIAEKDNVQSPVRSPQRVDKNNHRNRTVLYYGETSYWVSADTDVPLFLPLFGQRRQQDLRHIARREMEEGFKMSGQMNFDSGWEWGYWLNDVITARAAWDPHVEIRETWDAFNASLTPFISIFPMSIRPELSSIIVGLTKLQEDLLVYGNVRYNFRNQTKSQKKRREVCNRGEGTDNEVSLKDCEVLIDAVVDTITEVSTYGGLTETIITTIINTTTTMFNAHGGVDASESVVTFMSDSYQKHSNKLSGLAYIEGSDTWIDLPRLLQVNKLLQPDKVHIKEQHLDPELWNHALALLQAMEQKVYPFQKRMQALMQLARDALDFNIKVTKSTGGLTRHALELLSELNDSITMLYLRIKQVRLLYRSRDVHGGNVLFNLYPDVPEYVNQMHQGKVSEGNVKGGGDASTASMISESASKLQTQSRDVIHTAAAIVAEREKHYRVGWQRIAGWRDNPTVYRYGYLWSVHSLYYWWRDQGIAEAGSLQSAYSPCYLNRMDVSEVAIGWGKYTSRFLRSVVNKYSPFALGFPLELFNCFASPPREYQFPDDLYQYE